MNVGPKKNNHWGPFVGTHALSLTVLSVIVSSLAQAQTLDIKLSNGANSWEWQPAIISTTNGYVVNDVSYSPSGVKLDLYDTKVAFDPFISASVNVQNNSAVVQTYILTFTLPVPAIPGASVTGGSTQGGVTDANGSGVGTISTVPGVSLYYGQIDGANVLSLFPDPKSITVLFAGGSTNESANAGLPGLTIPGPAGTTSIGIQHEFTLTPGDIATFSSFFRVEQAIPEPAGFSLLAVS